MSSIRKRPDRPKPWQVLYRDPDDLNERGEPKQKSRSFRKKTEADAFHHTREHNRIHDIPNIGNAGKKKFRAFAEEWLAAQTFNESTREAVQSRLNKHLLPTFGGMELRGIRPSTVQAWLRGQQQELATSTVRVHLANLSGILGAAVADGLIASNPIESSAVRAPKKEDRRVIPWTREQVDAVIAAHPERYRAVPMPAAGCGLRQGETFGLALDAVDFLGRKVLVDKQLKIVRSRLVLAPPKGGRTREVPLPDVVAYALSEHLRHFPAETVTLPWKNPDGEPRTVDLIFTTREHRPLNRNYHNNAVWKPAVEAAGMEPNRANGMHALRHHWASVLLDGGVSIRALAEYLGHADPGFTLRTYTHLMPGSDDRVRAVVDGAFGASVAHTLTEGAQNGS